MKKQIGLISLLLFFGVNQVSAQTKVIKVNATKTNDYGVQYVLPKTLLQIQIDYSEIRQKAGAYAKYASRYLGMNDSEIVLEDQTLYVLDNVSVSETGVPNKDQSYLVLFKSKTTAPFVYLTEDGRICTINAAYRQPEELSTKSPSVAAVSGLPPLNPQSIYTEEYLRAGSISKMAEVAAKNIYKIRESRQDILTGETENVPKDGEAMKIILSNLDAQEKRWTELFVGTREVIHHSRQLVIEPTAELNKEILFRFSKYLGIVDADDLSGAPIFWDLKDLKIVNILEPDPKKKAKEPQSIVYNVPGKAEIQIYTAANRLYSSTVNVTQFGTTEILATELFEDKKTPVQVYFYPETGAIRQIIQ